MSLHRYGAGDDRLRHLEARAKQANEAFRTHMDECRTCFETAWNNELCIDGQKLWKQLRAVNDELAELDADVE